MSQDEDELLRQLDIRVRRSLGDDPNAATKILHLKKGPKAFKVATLRSWVSHRSGEVKTREFKVQTFNLSRLRGFAEPERPWSCSDEEIEALRTFLNAELSESGRYRLIRSGTDVDVLIEQVRNREVSPTSVTRLLEATQGVGGIVEALAKSDYATVLLEAVTLYQRRHALTELREVLENPGSTEHDIQRKIVGQTWIFGGQYAGQSHRREISSEDIVDIPLIRNDGSFHVVELKRANIANLIAGPRSHPIVGHAVHEATMQAANYLRTLDEDTHSNYHKYLIDCRRSTATVLIGHTNFVKGFTAKEISEALRTYNAMVSRVQVVTYDELLKAAERSLELADKTERFEAVPDEAPEWDEEPPF